MVWFFRRKKDRETLKPKAYIKTPLRIAMLRLRKHKLAIIGFWVLAVMYFMVIFADVIAPYRYDSSPRNRSNQPPSKIHFTDENGLSRQYIYNVQTGYKMGRRVLKLDKSKKYYIRFFARVPGEEHRLLGLVKTDRHFFSVGEPAKLYLFGSDWNGRCIFSRICYGSRVSLTVGLLGVAITFSLGLVIGGISGYFGGKIDTVMMRIVELLLSIPSFYLMLSLRAAFPKDLSSTATYVFVVGLLAFLGWPGLARVIRGMVLSIREVEYVLAAEAMGASRLKIIVRHILPNTFSYAIVAATLSIPGYIIGESALSVLGLGIQEPHASWGNMLHSAMNASDLQQFPWIVVPGFFIFFAIMAYNLLGDGLRDAFDPKGLV